MGRTWRGGQAQVWGLLRGSWRADTRRSCSRPRGRWPSACAPVRAVDALSSRRTISTSSLYGGSVALAVTPRISFTSILDGRTRSARELPRTPGRCLAPSRQILRPACRVASSTAATWTASVCISEGVRKVLVSAGIEPGKLVVVRSGIEVERWKNAAESGRRLCRDSVSRPPRRSWGTGGRPGATQGSLQSAGGSGHPARAHAGRALGGLRRGRASRAHRGRSATGAVSRTSCCSPVSRTTGAALAL
jgi:hypothetical protein